MKTQKNISNLRKLGLAVLASIALVNGTMKAEDRESANALVNLEIFVEAQEEALRYNAPVVMIEAEAAAESLENFATEAETSLRYDASEYADADAKAEEIAPAVNNLEMLASKFESQLKYQSPAEDAAVEAVPAMEKLEMLAESTLSNLKYQAPANAENEIYDVTDYSVNDMVAETR
jgi:hypothetical protein